MTEEKNTSSSATDPEKDAQHEETKEEIKQEDSTTTEVKAEEVKAPEVKTEETKPEEAPVTPEEVVKEEPTDTLEVTEPGLKDYSYLKPGMTVKVHQKIQEAGKKKDETKTRIQIFEGMILAIKNTGISKTITVRKVSGGVAVEKIFPIQLPTITEIEPVKQAKVRRSKLYYLRDLKGKKARIKEKV